MANDKMNVGELNELFREIAASSIPETDAEMRRATKIGGSPLNSNELGIIDSIFNGDVKKSLQDKNQQLPIPVFESTVEGIIIENGVEYVLPRRKTVIHRKRVIDYDSGVFKKDAVEIVFKRRNMLRKINQTKE